MALRPLDFDPFSDDPGVAPKLRPLDFDPFGPDEPAPLAGGDLAFGQRERGNLDGFDRPTLQNPDGSYSTSSSMSFGTDKGEVLVPTVVDGRRLSKDEAIARYRETGQHYGIFDTPENASTYAQYLHELQAEDQGRKQPELEAPAPIAPTTIETGEGAPAFGEQTRLGEPSTTLTPAVRDGRPAQALMRGAENLKATGYGLVALGADAVGADKVGDWALQGYKNTSELAKALASDVPSYKDVHTVTDAGKYAVDAVFENIPMFLPSLVTGGVGAMVARKGAEKVVERIVAEKMAEGLTREMAEKAAGQVILKRVGMASAAGAAPSSIGMEAGSIYGDIVDETGKRGGAASAAAAVGGVAAGALDVLPEVMVLKKALGPIVDEFTGSLVKRFGKETAKLFVTEAGTEGLQTVIEQASVMPLAPGKKLNWDEVIDSALKGGIGGAAFGAGGQAVAEVRNAAKPSTEEQIYDQIAGAQLNPRSTARAAVAALDPNKAITEAEFRGFNQLPRAALTPEEIAGPLPTDILAEGKALMDSIAGGQPPPPLPVQPTASPVQPVAPAVQPGPTDEPQDFQLLPNAGPTAAPPPNPLAGAPAPGAAPPTAAPEPVASSAPAPTLRTNGKPFKTEAEARLASKSRNDLKGKGYQPVQVEGGWGLATPSTSETGETVRAAPTTAPVAGSSSPAAGEPPSAQGSGQELSNGFRQGPTPQEKYRVSEPGAAGGAILLEKRNTTVNSAYGFYVGKDGGLIDAEQVAFNKPETVDRLWKPSSKEAAEKAKGILNQMGALDLKSPERAALKKQLQDLVAEDQVGGGAAAEPFVQPQGDGTRAAPAAVATAEDLDAARTKVNPQPTDAQKKAGNYAKGHIKLQGLDVTIENSKGSERSGVDADGKPWKVALPADYGYVKGTEGKDGDHVDVYVGPNPESAQVFVVDQYDLKTQGFDEHKIMLGYNSQREAEAAYDAAFSDGKGPQRRIDVTPMSMEDFKAWLASGKTKTPVADMPKPKAPALKAPVAKPKRGETEDADAITFLAARGGIRDDEGHDLLKGRNLQKFTQRGNLIRQDGMSIDQAGEALWDAGYFGPVETTARPDERQVLEFIERAAGTKTYLPDLQVQKDEEAKAKSGENRAYMERLAADYDIDPEGKTDEQLSEALSAVEAENAAADAFNAADVAAIEEELRQADNENDGQEDIPFDDTTGRQAVAGARANGDEGGGRQNEVAQGAEGGARPGEGGTPDAGRDGEAPRAVEPAAARTPTQKALDWIRSKSKLTTTDTIEITPESAAEGDIPPGTYEVKVYSYQGTVPGGMMTNLRKPGKDLVNDKYNHETLRLGDGSASGRNIVEYGRHEYTLKAEPAEKPSQVKGSQSPNGPPPATPKTADELLAQTNYTPGEPEPDVTPARLAEINKTLPPGYEFRDNGILGAIYKNGRYIGDITKTESALTREAEMRRRDDAEGKMVPASQQKPKAEAPAATDKAKTEKRRELMKAVSKATRLKGVAVTMRGGATYYDPLTRILNIGDNPGTDIEAIAALARGEAPTGWGETKVDVTLDDGTVEQVPARQVAQVLSDKIKRTASVLECLR